MEYLRIIQIVSYIILFTYLGFDIYSSIQKRKVNEIETFISDYKNFLVEQKVFKTSQEVTRFFTNGSCYLFARILKEQFPSVKIMINSSLTHCKVSYFGSVFDIRGVEKKSQNKEFRKADIEDIAYMKFNFGYKVYPYNMNIREFEQSFKEETLKSFLNNTSCSWQNISVSK